VLYEKFDQYESPGGIAKYPVLVGHEKGLGVVIGGTGVVLSEIYYQCFLKNK